ncbi:hypothetical protein STCU_12330 [Strigomonas culicis]|uniref:Uncharacterized protein n=1 Tax=Strigomonas culicis TaxID=28005 RepID=S9TAY0_9TRYP|nr:hypothetical protein STCU_12330 [Strigomonas culicis]|eukprot:EPY15127.1 hypothetical protein STCU_12330 [Strigomonas culicis]
MTPTSFFEANSGGRLSAAPMLSLNSTHRSAASRAAAASAECATLPEAIFLLDVRRPEREGRQTIVAEWHAGVQAIGRRLHAPHT